METTKRRYRVDVMLPVEGIEYWVTLGESNEFAEALQIEKQKNPNLNWFRILDQETGETK